MPFRCIQLALTRERVEYLNLDPTKLAKRCEIPTMPPEPRGGERPRPKAKTKAATSCTIFSETNGVGFREEERIGEGCHRQPNLP